MEALRIHSLGVRRASRRNPGRAHPEREEHFDCHPEASRAKGRVFCDPQIARSARIPIELLH
jgi:hypothetical protein